MNKYKELFIGILYAIISSITGFILAILTLSENSSILNNIQKAYQEDLLGKLISLGAILNIMVFFVFIKRNQDERAKGVLIVTLCIAILTVILKF